jgi:hypothetical protein
LWVNLRIPGNVVLEADWTNAPDPHRREFDFDAVAFRLICFIRAINPGAVVSLVAELRLVTETLTDLPITATLSMRNARPRDHRLHVRLDEELG